MWCCILSVSMILSIILYDTLHHDTESISVPIIEPVNKKTSITDYRKEFIGVIRPLIDTSNSRMIANNHQPIPPSLVMAQAIIESDWGRSRYSKEYHNLLGVHTPPQNGGIIIEKYNSYIDSIYDYMLLLNTDPHYEKFRDLNTISNDPKVIAEGLVDYSDIGDRYIVLVKNVIDDNNLTIYDTYSKREKNTKHDITTTMIINARNFNHP